MIFTEITCYKLTLDGFSECIDFIMDYNRNPKPLGRYELSGGGRASVCEYETQPSEKCIPEAHRKFIDVHYIISGQENVKHAFLDNVTAGKYDEEKDFVPVSGKFENSLTMSEGNILVLYPNDAHITKIVGGKCKKVKKIIFKIPVKEG